MSSLNGAEFQNNLMRNISLRISQNDWGKDRESDEKLLEAFEPSLCDLETLYRRERFINYANGLRDPANPEWERYDYFSPLETAVRVGNLEAVQQLFSHYEKRLPNYRLEMTKNFAGDFQRNPIYWLPAVCRHQKDRPSKVYKQIIEFFREKLEISGTHLYYSGFSRSYSTPIRDPLIFDEYIKRYCSDPKQQKKMWNFSQKSSRYEDQKIRTITICEHLAEGIYCQKLIEGFEPSKLTSQALNMNLFYPLETAIKAGNLQAVKSLFTRYQEKIDDCIEMMRSSSNEMQVPYRPIFWLAAVCDHRKATPQVDFENYTKIIEFLNQQLNLTLDHVHKTDDEDVSFTFLTYVDTFCADPKQKEKMIEFYHQEKSKQGQASDCIEANPVSTSK